jgi:hypothetical protein
MNKSEMVKEVIENFCWGNLDNLQNKLDVLDFETKISDVSLINGKTSGQVFFVDENSVNKVIDFTITNE